MKNTINEELDGGKIDVLESDSMDATDRAILSIIQSEFPLASRPYQIIGKQVNISEEEALARVQKLREKKIVRRIGANFQSSKFNFHSTLCAAKVPANKIKDFTSIVNSFTGITHNYLRENKYNIWFTCIGSSEETVSQIINEIEKKTGIKVMNLPATKIYKIKVNFQM